MSIRRVAPVLMAALLAGCGSFGAIGLSSPFSRAAAPAAPDPITPAPSAPVDTSNLPPPNAPPADQGAPPPSTADTTGTTAPPATAPATAPTASGSELSRTDLLGGWTIAANGESCQLFMTLTSWTGGYRASTRGCNSDPLKSISAWSLDGRQVVLAGAAGAPVARLASSGNARFDGQIEGGSTPVSFYR